MQKNDGSAPPARLAAASMEKEIFQKAGMLSGQRTEGMGWNEMRWDGVAYGIPMKGEEENGRGGRDGGVTDREDRNNVLSVQPSTLTQRDVV